MKIQTKIMAILFVFVAVACSKDDNEVQPPEVIKSDAKALTSFVFKTSDNTVLEENLSTTITEASKTATASLPNGTDVSALTPAIEISEKASISPTGTQDFRTPVTYTVTAEDGSKSTYRATIMVLASDAKQIVSFVFKAGANVGLSEDVVGSIEEVEKTIAITVSASTDITALVPAIEIPENATINPIDAQDFAVPVVYTVTAENGSKASYTATVTVLEAPNRAPLDFELLSPTASGPNGGIALTPTLRWNESEDPDGDIVTYDIYLNIGDTADELYAQNITETNYPITQYLNFEEFYSWRVVAKDPEGASTSTITEEFSTREVRFIEASEAASSIFSGRSEHSSVVFQNKLWVIGGFGNGAKNDVWSSLDGVDWSLVTNNAAFEARLNHTSVVFDNKIWVIGGNDSQQNIRNDVWYSEDGSTWVEATNAADFPPRYLHTSVVFDDKMWVIAGFGNGRKNDVWYSSDGVNWLEATANALFSPRQDHNTLVFDNKIWLIGGFDNKRKNDVWFSTDGNTWTEATTSLPFTVRASHSSVVFGNKIWIIGGNDGRIFKNDIWSSKDGISWSNSVKEAPFNERNGHTSVVFDNKIWIIAGYTGDDSLDDVWYFD